MVVQHFNAGTLIYPADLNARIGNVDAAMTSKYVWVLVKSTGVDAELVFHFSNEEHVSAVRQVEIESLYWPAEAGQEYINMYRLDKGSHPYAITIQ